MVALNSCEAKCDYEIDLPAGCKYGGYINLKRLSSVKTAL